MLTALYTNQSLLYLTFTPTFFFFFPSFHVDEFFQHKIPVTAPILLLACRRLLLPALTICGLIIPSPARVHRHSGRFAAGTLPILGGDG